MKNTICYKCYNLEFSYGVIINYVSDNVCLLLFVSAFQVGLAKCNFTKGLGWSKAHKHILLSFIFWFENDGFVFVTIAPTSQKYGNFKINTALSHKKNMSNHK